MYNRITQCISLLFILGSMLAGCQEEDLDTSLRSDENDTFYWENNKIASQRLASIMYNKTDSSTIYERFKIVHISDPHLSEKSLSNYYQQPFNLIQSIRFANQQELKINALVATGDLISNAEKKEAMLYMKSFIQYFYKGNRIPSFLCTGNHDSNIIESIPNSTINKVEVNQILHFNSNYKQHGPTSENYFYSDVPNPQGGFIRIISLDMLDQPGSEYNTMINASFSQAQVDWLGNVALKKDMTKDHSVIILEHYPFQPYRPNATTYLCDGDFIHSYNMIPEVIEAYRSRTPLNTRYPNKFNGKEITVDFDFSSSSGEFICYMGGHAHCNAYFNIKGLGNTAAHLLPQKMILCTNQAPSEAGRVYNRIVRQEDSLTSNSFCIYAIDTKEKKIYVTFFGAYMPADNTNYPETFSISYL